MSDWTDAPRFDTSTPVLNLVGRPPKRSREKWVLWPVVAHRVIVPEARTGQLNPFQRAVLGLAAAGVRDVGETSKRLDLPTDLVAFVAYELQARGLIDGHGEITSVGQSARTEGAAPSAARESAHVFADAVSGRLWSRVLTGPLTYADANLKHKQPAIKAGTIGGSFKRKMAVVRPPYVHLEAPSDRAILQAFQADRDDRGRHQHVLDAEQERRGWTSFADAETASRVHATVDRVTLAGAAPTPFYIPVAVYVPGTLREGSRWRARDPFGMGDSSELRHLFQAALEAGDAHALEEAVAELQDQQASFSGQEVAEADDSRRAAAERSVDARLGTVDGVSDDLRRRLVAMEENAPPSGAAAESAEDRQRHALRHAYSALEQLLADSLASLPTDSVLPALHNSNPKENVRKLLRIADKLGFLIPDPDHSDRRDVEALFRTTRQRCLNVVQYGGHHLPNQLAVAVLVANRHPDYPLAEFAQRCPEALSAIARLRRARNAAAHGDDPGWFDTDSRDLVFEASSALLGLRGSVDPDAPQGGGLDLDLVFHVRARNDVDQAFGAQLRALPRLYQAAVRHRAESLRAHQLLALEPIGLDRDILTGSLAVLASTVIERAAAAWLRLAPPPDALGLDGPDVPDRIPDRLNAAALSLGALEAGDSLPESLLKVKTHKLAASLAAPDRSTLAALICTALLCGEQDRSHPAGRIIRHAPHLVLQAAEVAALRGHGASAPFSEPAVTLLAETPFACIDATLSTL